MKKVVLIMLMLLSSSLVLTGCVKQTSDDPSDEPTPIATGDVDGTNDVADADEDDNVDDAEDDVVVDAGDADADDTDTADAGDTDTADADVADKDSDDPFDVQKFEDEEINEVFEVLENLLKE